MLRRLLILMFALFGLSTVVACSDDTADDATERCAGGERYNELTGRCEGRGGGPDTGRLPDAQRLPDAGRPSVEDVQHDTHTPGDTGRDTAGPTPGDCASGSATYCVDPWTMGVCQQGAPDEEVACGLEGVCQDGRCRRADGACSPGARTCKSDTTTLVCRGDGRGFDAVDCPIGELCHRGACEPMTCVPEQVRCDGNQVMRCAQDGSGESVAQTCAPSETCEAGRCVQDLGPCADQKGYVGCEFMAADLDHMRPGNAQQFGVTVSNSHSAPVEVRITDGDGALVVSRTIAQGSLETFELPRRDVDNSGLTRQSHIVESTGPVTVHQFNPLSRSGVASTDASLLLPSHALGTDYMVLGWPTTTSGRVTEGRAYMTIIAPHDGTDVTVTTAAAIDAGPGVAAMAAGQTATFSLARGQVLSLSTPNRAGLDLSGSTITSSRPVAVFSGSECADVPVGTAACDHLEQQLFPVATWGNTMVAAKFVPRGTESDVYRIIASEDATLVQFTPAVDGTTQTLLNRGQVFQFATPQNFVVQADRPISLGQFMIGASGQGVCTSFLCLDALGDPAFLLNVAIEQYRLDYIIFVPSGFAQNYLNISAPEGASVTVDGRPPSSAAAAIAGTPWRVYQVPVGPGVHHVEATQPVGLTVHGYDQYVSYAYPGGLSLEVQ